MAGYYGSGNSFSDKIAAEMKERAKKTAKKWLKRMDLRSSMFLMRFTMYSALQGLTARSIFRRSNC